MGSLIKLTIFWQITSFSFDKDDLDHWAWLVDLPNEQDFSSSKILLCCGLCLIFILQFQKWLPNEKSAVLINDFKSPKELAEFLLNLNENDNEYNTYLSHKSLDIHPVNNQILLNELATRSYRTKSLLEDFECFVCSNNIANKFKKGYECGETLILPPMEENRVTVLDWQSSVTQGKCEAETLIYFLSKNVPYSEKDYSNEMFRRYEHGQCKMWQGLQK